MKILTLVLSVIALGLILFNATLIDLNTPFEGDSVIAIITILASLCVIIMMAILRVSNKIDVLSRKRV